MPRPLGDLLLNNMLWHLGEVQVDVRLRERRAGRRPHNPRWFEGLYKVLGLAAVLSPVELPWVPSELWVLRSKACGPRMFRLRLQHLLASKILPVP